MCPKVKARLLRARTNELVSLTARLSSQVSFQNQFQKILDISGDEEWFSLYQKKLESIREMYDYIGKPEKASNQNDWAFLGYVRKTAHRLFEQVLEQYPHD
jgi:hypothetical protein